MDPKSPNLGSSLEVPIVQELVKEISATVPPRYVIPDRDSCIIPSNPSFLPDIPVINMHNLFNPDDLMDSELDRLHNACQEWGFFQLINHGVDSALVDTMKSEIQGFFNLPIEEKKKFRQVPGDIQGYGQSFVVSEEQKLDWGDLFNVYTLPVSLRVPHLIPKLPEKFRIAIESYSTELKKLAMKILHQLAKALGINAEEIESLFEDGYQPMRMNYYPPCPQPELVTGLCPHSDGGALTILLQVNEMEGLQIKKDGIWVPVAPLPNAFIINVGDMLEILTNGTYRSIEHQAIVNSRKERLSIATFLSPKLDGDLGPSPSLVTPKTPAKFKRIGVDDYLRRYLSKELKGKSSLEAMRI